MNAELQASPEVVEEEPVQIVTEPAVEEPPAIVIVDEEPTAIIPEEARTPIIPGPSTLIPSSADGIIFVFDKNNQPNHHLSEIKKVSSFKKN